MLGSLSSLKPKDMVYNDNMVAFTTDKNYEEKIAKLGDNVRNFDYDVEEKNGKTYYVITTNSQTTQSRKAMKKMLQGMK